MLMLNRIATHTRCRVLLQMSWCRVVWLSVSLLVTTVNPTKTALKTLFGSRLTWAHKPLLGRVDIVATRQLWWNDLCSTATMQAIATITAAQHWHLLSCSNVFFYPGFAVVWIQSVLQIYCLFDLSVLWLQCFDTVGWASGRASGL